MPIDSTTSLKGVRLAVVVPESPTFLARTSSAGNLAAFGGVIGAAASAGWQLSEGERMVHQFGILDPALATGRELATRLRKTYSMSEAAASALPTTDDVNALVAAAPQADMILDIRSEIFGINYLAKEPEKHFVMSTSWARLIDVQSRKVLAEARCIPTDGPPTATLEKLLEDNAAVLKNDFAAHVALCVEQLTTKMRL